MISVGITGGIGSGKSTVCEFFELIGIPVYYADHRAKDLMTENQQLKSDIQLTFGKGTYFEDGSLNRPFFIRKGI